MKIRRWPYVIGTSVLFMTVTGCATDDGAGATQSNGSDDASITELTSPTDSDTGGNGTSDAQVAVDTVEADGILPDGTENADGSVAADTIQSDDIAEADIHMEEDAASPMDTAVMMDTEEESMDAQEQDSILQEDSVSSEDTTDEEDVSLVEPDADAVADVGDPVKEEFGACCTANFDCVDMDDAKECTIAGGYFEEGLSCAEDWPCPVPGFAGISVAGRQRRAVRSIRRV